MKKIELDYNDEELFSKLLANFKDCDHPAANGFSFSVNTGGSEGGNCWGDYSRQYKRDKEDIVSDVYNQIVDNAIYYFNILGIKGGEELIKLQAEHLYEETASSSYDSTSECEYYGNYRDLDLFVVGFSEILNFLDGYIDPSKKEEVLSIAAKATNEIVNENSIQNKYKELKAISKKIDDFPQDSKEEIKVLEDNIQTLRNKVAQNIDKLQKIGNKHTKDLKKLKQQQKEIIEFLGEDFIKGQEVKKTKQIK